MEGRGWRIAIKLFSSKKALQNVAKRFIGKKYSELLGIPGTDSDDYINPCRSLRNRVS
jgi:hypothetical protein